VCAVDRAIQRRCQAHVGQVEAGLALGAEPAVTVAPYVQSAVYASLLPRLDMLKSLGLVWIPGMMVSGASRVYSRHLPVYSRRHDLSGIGNSGPARHGGYPKARLLAGSTIDAPPRGAAQAEIRTRQCAISRAFSSAREGRMHISLFDSFPDAQPEVERHFFLLPLLTWKIWSRMQKSSLFQNH
jgi:hypothetical protein